MFAFSTCLSQPKARIVATPSTYRAVRYRKYPSQIVLCNIPTQESLNIPQTVILAQAIAVAAMFASILFVPGIPLTCIREALLPLASELRIEEQLVPKS